MAEFEIVCRDRKQRKTVSGAYVSYISHFGVKQADGSVHLVPHGQMLGWVQGGGRYYVERNGFRAYLEVFTNEWGNVLLRTEPDDIPVNNLLALPACTEADGAVVPTGDGSGIDHDGGDVEPGSGGSDGGGDDG